MLLFLSVPTNEEQRAKKVNLPLQVPMRKRLAYHLLSVATWGVLGVLMVMYLQQVMQWIGGILCVVAALHGARAFIQWRFAVGSFLVDKQSVHLPRSIARRLSPARKVPVSELGSVFMLRRTKVLGYVGPTLVVETRDGNRFLYPRDSFRSGSDQEKIYQALKIIQPST